MNELSVQYRNQAGAEVNRLNTLGLMIHTLQLAASGPGLQGISHRVVPIVLGASLNQGLCTLFIRHTSASLTIQENADPSARRGLEVWLDRLVPEGAPPLPTPAEGPDDMPAHIKAILTATSLSIPILDGRLALGTWQGIYLWEHRRQRSHREVVVHVGA